MNNEIMNKLKTDILNMHKKIKMYRGGVYAPPLPPSVKGGVIGELRSPTPTSTNYLNHTKLREEYRTILETAYNTINNQPTNDGKRRGKWHAEVLYQLMAHTRDIAHGYGERDLAYMQLFEWARVDVPLAKHALELFVNNNNGKNSSIGSWKDVKSFFAYMRRVIRECSVAVHANHARLRCAYGQEPQSFDGTSIEGCSHVEACIPIAQRSGVLLQRR